MGDNDNDAYYDDPLWDQRQEEQWEAAHAPEEPAPHTLAWAIEHGYEPEPGSRNAPRQQS